MFKTRLMSNDACEKANNLFSPRNKSFALGWIELRTLAIKLLIEGDFPSLTGHTGCTSIDMRIKL